MKPLAAIAFLASALPALAQNEEPARPKSPEIAWVDGSPRLIELPPEDPRIRLIPDFPIPEAGDGRWLFGPTAGLDARPGPGGVLIIQPRTEDGTTADPVQIKGSGRRFFEFVYGSGKPVTVAVEILAANRWKYRIAAILEVTTPEVSLTFFDANGNGLFDDLDADKVAIGAAQDAAKLRFEIFTGEISASGKRWLVSANPRAAGVWPVSASAPKEYVRHVSDVNAVRRYGGLPPVGLAEELIPLCEAHSRYCAKNGLTHYEEKGKPLFTPGGEYAGRNCNVGTTNWLPKLLATLWHRNPYYDATLSRVSFGIADGWGCSDVHTYREVERVPTVAPFRRALEVELDGVTEIPYPYPGKQRAGPFVTVLLPIETVASLKSGSITPRGGTPLEFDSSDPAHPTEKAKQDFPDNDACIVLIPHQALKPDTIYDVNILAIVENKPETYAWSFRTKRSGR
ncbi:MAG: CAP domain-containing protein [Planctomycetota bacterium]|mgnify:CR=1 FL=1